MKYNEILEQVLSEINMSPNSLKSLAAGINAQAGMEFEMIVPNVESDDDNYEPDYDEDQRSRSFGDIEEFFSNEGYNSRRDIEQAIQQMQEEFYEWSDDRINEDWASDQFDHVYLWVKNNASDDEVREELGLDDDHELTKEDWNNFTQSCIDIENSFYDDAREDYFDDARAELDEEEWLRRNYPNMSDVENNFTLTWPYYTSGDGADIETIASDFEDAIGKTVHWSSNYHGGKREPNAYTVEPDGSLDADDSDDSGLEFISPPMSIADMISDLDKIAKWAGRMGCYTNNSTGLHMNVSIPDLSTAKLDYVKLALLLGDEYVLDQFGRQSNTYAKSAMKIVKDRIRERPEDASAMLNQMKEHLGALATKVIHSGETSKYTSINTKGGYVEFRSPGGDWLQEYADNPGKITTTLLRFVVALDAALDPKKYRNEYLKKLYTLLAPKSDTDTLAYFARYVAGEMPKAALKSFIKQAQLERNIKAGKTGGEDFKWEVGRPGYGASIIVTAKTKEEAIDRALQPDGYPDWANARSQLTAKVVGPANTSPVRATAGEPQPVGANAPAAEGSMKYELFNRTTDQVYRTFYAADDQMAIEIGHRYRDELRAANPDVSIGLRRAPIPGSTVDRQRQRAQQAQQAAPASRIQQVGQTYTPPGGSSEFTGQWLILDGNNRILYKFGGIGNSQSDANRHAMEWLRQNPENMRDGLTVVPEMS